MPYTINLSSGDILTTVIDGDVDTTSTSLSLIGKNSTSYGEFQNENFVHLLENFSNSTAPIAPLKGQIWYDAGPDNRLKVYNGTAWRSIGSAIVNASAPATSTSVTGDLWLDTSSNRLYVRTSAEWRLVGPVGNSADGEIGLKQENIVDISAVTHKIVGIYSKGTRIGIISDDTEFTTSVTGFTTIKPGITLNSSITGIRFNGTSVSTDLFGGFTATQFMRTDAATGTTGILSVTNNGGILVGANSELSLTISSNDVNISNSFINADINLRTWDGSTFTNLITLDGTNKVANTLTAVEGTNTTQIATTAFVQTATQKWDGARRYVSTSAPTSGVGANGDIWMQREA
jgi:hypothetical protein